MTFKDKAFNRFFLFSIFIICLLTTSLIFISRNELIWLAYSLKAQIIIIILSLAWPLLWLCFSRFFSKNSSLFNFKNFLFLNLVWIIAIYLHQYVIGIFPNPKQPGVEEILAGTYCFRTYVTHELIPKWRFSAWLGSLAWEADWGFTIEALRIPSQIVGALGIGAFILCLRHLQVGLWITAFLSFSLATIKWTSYSMGGTMWFNYFGVAPALFLVLLLFKLDKYPYLSSIFASLIGTICGIFIYEYAPFQLIALFAFIWVLRLTLLKKLDWRGTWRIAPVIAFSLSFIIMLIPLIAHISIQGFSNYLINDLLEPVFRYKSERTSSFSPHFLLNLKKCYLVFSGQFSESDVTDIIKSPLILPVIGKLLLLGFIATLLCLTKSALLFGLALLTITACIGTSALKNSLTSNHLGAFAPFLFIMSGAFLQRLCDFFKWITSKIFKNSFLLDNRFIFILNALIFVPLSGWIFIQNTEQLRITSLDKIVNSQFDSNDYLVCDHLKNNTGIGQKVQLITSIQVGCNIGDSEWITYGKKLDIQSTPNPLQLSDLAPNSLVAKAIWSESDDADKELIEFEAFAKNAGFEGKIAITRTPLGVPRTVSFCYKCQS